MVRATELPPRLEARAHAHAGGRRVRGEDGPGEASVAAAKTRAAGRPRGSARARSRPRSRRAALRGCRDVPAQPSPRRARAPGRRRRSRRRRRAMKPPIDASRFGSAAAAYQATLPGVRCEHANGQIELLDVTIDTSAIANEPRLVAAAELVELGQLQLGLPGVLPTRTPGGRGM